MIELEDGYRIYHAGDTEAYSDMRLIKELHRPDLAMLPIGGHYTMDPAGAALAIEFLGVEEVMPLHYGTFPILAGTPAQLARRPLGARPGLGPRPRAGARRNARLDELGADRAERHAVEPGGVLGTTEVELQDGVGIAHARGEDERL